MTDLSTLASGYGFQICNMQQLQSTIKHDACTISAQGCMSQAWLADVPVGMQDSMVTMATTPSLGVAFHHRAAYSCVIVSVLAICTGVPYFTPI